MSTKKMIKLTDFWKPESNEYVDADTIVHVQPFPQAQGWCLRSFLGLFFKRVKEEGSEITMVNGESTCVAETPDYIIQLMERA